MIVTALFSCLLFAATSSPAFIDKPPAIVNYFWYLVDKDLNSEVVRFNLETFFKRYDDNQIDPLNVNETQFLTGSKSWTNDFNLTEEEALANFRGLDRATLSTDDYPVITNGDLNIHVSTGDASGNGILDESEFKAGYNALLRSMHFAVMFNRYDIDDDTFIDKAEFETIYFDMNDPADSNGETELSKSEMADFFVNGTYTNATMAEQFFDNLIYYGFSTNNVTINRDVDWPRLFTDLDVTLPGSYLEFDTEFEELDNIMHA